MKKGTEMAKTRMMFIGLLITFLYTSAYAGCYQIYGIIQLKENPVLCESLDENPNEPYIGTCFKVNTIGNAIFTGTSALTASPVTSMVQGDALTPLFLIGERQGLQFFTSRSSLSGIIWTKDGIFSGSINTIDTGTIDLQDGMAAEILTIQSGENDFEGASGRVLVYGTEIAPEWATYSGKICIND